MNRSSSFAVEICNICKRVLCFLASSTANEEERKHATRPNRSAAVDELGYRWHLQIGANDDDADRQQGDGSYLKEGREIIARRE